MMRINGSNGKMIDFRRDGEYITLTLYVPPSATARMSATVRADEFRSIYPLEGQGGRSVCDENNGIDVRFDLEGSFVQIGFTPITVSEYSLSYSSEESTRVSESALRAAYDEFFGSNIV